MKVLKKNQVIMAFLLVCLSLGTINLFAQERDLQIESDGFRWYKLRLDWSNYGVQTLNGDIIIPLSRGYESLYYSGDGYFSVKKNGKRGVCGIDGKEIIAPKYDKVVRHGEEGNYYFGVELNGKEGACDINGREIIAPKYDNVCMHGSNDNYYYSVEINGKEGLCDLRGKEIVKPEYDKYSVTYNAEEGYYRMKQNGKSGALDKDGNQIIPPMYKELRYSSNDFFEYKDGSGNWVSLGVTLLDGNPTKPLQKDAQGRILHTQSNGFKWYEIENSGCHGVMNLEGNVVVPLSKSFDSVYYMKNDGGWFGVKKNGKVGVYDLAGHELLSPVKYDDVICVKDKDYLCCIVKYNGAWGACDAFGKEIVAPVYDAVAYLSSDAGCLSISRNGKKGVCDKTTGHVIIAPNRYDFACYFNKDGYEYCMVGNNNKFGVCNMNGQEIIAPKYDLVFFNKNYYAIQLNGKMGACGLNGKEIIKPNYESLIYSSDVFKYQDPSGNWVSTGITLAKDGGASYASSSYSTNSSSSNSSNNNDSKMTRKEKVETVFQVLGAVANAIQQSNNTAVQHNNNSAVQPAYTNGDNNVNYNNSTSHTKSKTICAQCHGTGRCSYCGGTHVRTNQFSHEKVECVWCNKNGDCHWCNGKGVIE